MHIRELSVAEFEEFANKNKYDNFRQSLSYALFKCEENSEYEIIGYGDEGCIEAAAIVIVKMIDKFLYAYVPHGFLIDYNDQQLLNNFTNDLIKYYKKDDISFIKVNPPAVIAEINPKTLERQELYDNRTAFNMERAGYNHLGYNYNFEALLPRFDAIINLKEYNINNLTKNCRNKVRKAVRKGLNVELAERNQIGILKDIIGDKLHHNAFYYNDYYNVFARKNEIDYFLVSLDYQEYLKNSTKSYEKEIQINDAITRKIGFNGSPKYVNKKMNSDKKLLAYKNDISIATKNLYAGKKYIAAALVVKYKDTVNIVLSGYNKDYKAFVPNYLLYYEIINYYKNDYKYLYMNGMSGNFEKDSKYYGLNKFKMEFNPIIHEYAGEFDLIINHYNYNYMLRKNILAREFNK